MIKVISPQTNASLKPITRVLFVLRPWQSGESGGGSAIRRQLLEYRANPRSVRYMLDRAEEFKTRYAPDTTADLFIESDALMSEEDCAWFRQIQTTFANLSGYDTIIFLYPDAIGLGWGALEHALGDLHAQQYIVINGRRRIFIWDDASRRALAWRRLLYRVSFLEGLFATLVFIAGVWFTVADLWARGTRTDQCKIKRQMT